ncbi:MAG TPA: FAD:protein FMN transferase [Gemmatimonadales bacterium]
MGTRFELVLPGGEPARAVGEAALEEIETCHARFSRFDEASLLNHILRVGPERPVPLDADSYALFEDAVTVWRDSDGAFDPTAPLGGMDALVLDAPARLVRLARPVPRLDLGAIAKGHALDLAALVLRSHGIASAFLHGGTSSAVGIGAPSGEPGWRVALAGGGEVLLKSQAMSVSAVWEGNPHPTLDPRTGQPVPGPRRAVVVGPGARLADAWSTAGLVLGRRPAAMPPEWDLTISVS